VRFDIPDFETRSVGAAKQACSRRAAIDHGLSHPTPSTSPKLWAVGTAERQERLSTTTSFSWTGRTQLKESRKTSRPRSGTAYEESIIKNYDEGDPLSASMELAHFVNDVEKLRAQKANAMNAEW
jgi:hypothetical protein